MKERVEAFISTKLKHTDITDTPIGSWRRQLLDLKVSKIIHQLSGEPTQLPIDYIQCFELSSSLLYLLVSPLYTRTPTPSRYTSSKVSDASTLIITAGIICMFAKCHRLKSTGDQVEREELTREIKTQYTLRLTKKKKKPTKLLSLNTMMEISNHSIFIYTSFIVFQLQIYFFLSVIAIYSTQAEGRDLFRISRD